MKFVYSDGGRSNYYKGIVGDCVVRAICNATNSDYQIVYKSIQSMQGVSPRNGVSNKNTHKYIEEILGLKWIPTMKIGQGCKTHLCEEELPKGVLIVKLSHHLSCVKNGVLYDIYDCTRDGNRCVYGYWIVEE